MFVVDYIHKVLHVIHSQGIACYTCATNVSCVHSVYLIQRLFSVTTCHYGRFCCRDNLSGPLWKVLLPTILMWNTCKHFEIDTEIVNVEIFLHNLFYLEQKVQYCF